MLYETEILTSIIESQVTTTTTPENLSESPTNLFVNPNISQNEVLMDSLNKKIDIQPSYQQEEGEGTRVELNVVVVDGYGSKNTCGWGSSLSAGSAMFTFCLLVWRMIAYSSTAGIDLIVA